MSHSLLVVMQYIILSMKVDDEQDPSMCKKRLRPLAPRLCEAPSLDLNSLETGGSRWNPTQEQIGILEMVYKRGMRTPNTQQIEQITEQLSKYGRIQGKNVFYWFQNHKARERQKQKRNIHINGGLSLSPTSSLITINNNKETPYKRKCMSWAFDPCLEEEQEESTITTISTSTRASTWSWLSCKDNEQYATLELFPLHPEGR